MPRDSSGQFTLPSGTLVNTGDTILVSQHNPAMQDIEQSMSNSLDRDGKGGMRAPLNMGGNRIQNAAPGEAPSDAVTLAQLSGFSSLPIGAVVDYAGTTPPTGFLLCFGQAVSRSTYASLFAVLGTSFGTGDGSTTFNLPDLRGRVAAGKDDMGGTAAGRLTSAGGVAGATQGAAGGSQTVALTEAQMPAHNHGVNDPGHRHTAASITSGGLNGGDGFLLFDDRQTSTNTTGITIQNKGGGQAHPNVQPTLILSKIIKATS